MSSAPKASTRRPYPHFEDLVQEINIDAQKHASIKRWLEEAQSHWKNFQFQEQLGRVDGAYLDFMKAAEIVFHVIPAHKEYPTFKSNPGNAAYKDYTYLLKNLEAQFGKADTLKNEIKKDNERHGTKRKHQTQQETRSSTQDTHVNGADVSKSNALSQKKPPPVPAKPSSVSGQSLATGTLSNPSASPDKIQSLTAQRIDGKPNGYTQKPISKPIGSDARSVPSVDDLSARFDRLRSSSSLSRLPPDTNGSSSPKSSILSATSASAGSRGRPSAHRELPVSPRLDTSVITGLPRPPSPTYSPARNSISPARSIPRKPMSTSSAINLTNETTLSPAALSTYISRSTEISLLVLDVRERTEYDEGHIPAKAIICIEPLQLREGTTGDDLEDSVSLSLSSREHELFSKRHTYDLVVYHDQSTASDAFLNQRTNDQHLVTLQRLHQALCDLSYQKPLKRPPVLLSGGLKAWTDVFGPSSLVFGNSRPNSPPSSHKSSAVGLGISTISRGTPVLPEKVDQRSRPQGKKGDTNDALRIDIAKEEAWLQKLQGEHEPLTISVPIDAENMDVKRQRRSTSIVAASETFPRTIEQFFQQFPASPSTQSMMSPIPGTPALATPSTPGFASKKYTIIDHPFYGFTDVRNPDFHPPPSPVRPPPALPRKSYKGESEKPPFRPIDPPIPVEKSSMVGFTEHTLASPTRLHNFATVGIQNYQNCCYMNAVIQCISGSIPLARYFLDGSYKMHIARSNNGGVRGQFVDLLANMVTSLWAGKYKFISPKNFKEYCGSLRPEFGGNLQNDAQEFLDFLMNSLHDDLNPNASRSELQPLTQEQEEYRETLPIPYASHLEWQRYIHRNYSVVINWFQGQYFSRLVCQVCNFQSTSYAPFFTLTLHIPPGKKNPTIYECITHFLCQEVHETVEWKCTKCKINRPTKKTLGLTRLPHMLVIHLSRFKYSNGLLGPLDAQKISIPVQYPLRKLQLDTYVPQMGDGNYGGPPGMEAPFQPAPEQTAPFIYDLYGVVKHEGTAEGGHYTCLIKDSWAEQWKNFDDSRMRVVDEDEVQSRETQSKAYMLFWVRKNIM